MSTERPLLFEGKYEVLEKIAEGGMGAIYKVRHVLLNEVRVIKVMRPHAAEKEEHRRRFLREAQTATKLRHPNIVTFYDFAMDENDTAYMVMEFIDGVTFNQLIRSAGPMPPAIVLTLAKQCLSALGFLHRRGIVHRDVSPDNMMIAREEEAGAHVKLIDLGIAKAVQEESLTVGAAFIGKLRYCSPEQLNMGTPLDGRSDLFSFGIVLSEMLTGICPLPGDSAQSILMAHVSGKFLPFEHTDPHGRVPASLRAIVDRALQIERSARIQTAEDFIASIEEVEAREGFRARPAELREFADRAIGARPVTPPRPASSASPLEAWLLPPTVRLVEPAVSEKAVEKTERWPTAAAPPAEKSAAVEKAPEARPSRPWLWLIGSLLVLAGAAGYWALNRSRAVPEEHTSAPKERPIPPPQPTSGAPIPTAVPAPTCTPVEAALPAAVAEPTASVPKTRHAHAAKPEPPLQTRLAPPVEPAATRPARIAEAIKLPPKAPAERVRYCTILEPTSYAQAKVSEKPAGFDTGGAEVFRGPRPDAARIAIRAQVDPPNPLEGQQFRVVARVVNGGDMGITLARIDESAITAPGGFRPVQGVTPPATVQVGASLTIYSFTGVLTEGNAYAKELRITDSVGDTWKTSIRVGVCPD